MNALGVPQGNKYPHFFDPNQSTISDACECNRDRNNSDCSCSQTGQTTSPPPGGEKDETKSLQKFALWLIAIPVILGGVMWLLQKYWPSRFGPGGQADSASPSKPASPAPQNLRSAAHIVRDLVNDFNFHVGKNIPSYEAVEDRLRRYHNLRLYELTPNARSFYVQFAIDQFVESAINRYDPATAANAFWFLNFDDYVTQNPLLLQDDRRQAESKALRYVRIAQEHMASVVTRSANEAAVRMQIGRHFNNDSYFNNYLGSMGLRTWNVLAPRQTSWFVSNTMRHLATKSGELPPLFEKWFLRNAEPKLMAHLEQMWAAMPEIFRNAMGKSAISFDPFPAVFYEMMLEMDSSLEQSFQQIFERDKTPVDWDNLPQTDPVTVERRAIVAANPELAPYSNFVTVLANARLAVARNRTGRNGSGSGSAGAAGAAGRGETSPATSVGPETTRSSEIGLFRWFVSPRIVSPESAKYVPWQDGSKLRRHPIVPDIPRDEDAGETGERRRDVPTPARKPARQDRTPPPVRRASATPEEENTSTARGLFDPEEVSTGAGLAPIHAPAIQTGAGILFGRGRQTAHRPATHTARPVVALRPAVLVRPPVATIPAL